MNTCSVLSVERLAQYCLRTWISCPFPQRLGSVVQEAVHCAEAAAATGPKLGPLWLTALAWPEPSHSPFSTETMDPRAHMLSALPLLQMPTCHCSPSYRLLAAAHVQRVAHCWPRSSSQLLSDWTTSLHPFQVHPSCLPQPKGTTQFPYII